MSKISFALKRSRLCDLCVELQMLYLQLEMLYFFFYEFERVNIKTPLTFFLKVYLKKIKDFPGILPWTPLKNPSKISPKIITNFSTQTSNDSFRILFMKFIRNTLKDYSLNFSQISIEVLLKTLLGINAKIEPVISPKECSRNFSNNFGSLSEKFFIKSSQKFQEL